jgi:positive phototaxis protein PixI
MSTSSPASRIQANLQELFEGKIASGDAYIKFKLTSKITALLSMNQVQESLIVEAAKITPLPSMPKSTIGMINSRDRVFCIFDLAQLLNLPTVLITPSQYQIIVLQTTGESSILVGLAVMGLQGIIRLTSKQIPSANSNVVNSSLAPFVSGVVQQETTMMVLELANILQALQA